MLPLTRTSIEMSGKLTEKQFLYLATVLHIVKMKNQTSNSKTQHPPTHKATAGMSVNYLMGDQQSHLLT